MAPLFIINPVAGGRRTERARRRIAAIVATRDLPYHERLTTGPGTAAYLAREGADSGFDPIVAVGGDGTVHEVANGLLARAGPPAGLGIVPLGSGNDLARSLDLPARIDAAVSVAIGSTGSEIDAARCGERVFLNAASVGFDALIAARLDDRRTRTGSGGGSFGYWKSILAALPSYAAWRCEIELDGWAVVRHVLLVAVTNGRFYGGGFEICPTADPADGVLDVCIIGARPVWRAIRLLPALRRGRHTGLPGIEHYRARVVRIRGDRAPLQLDGEVDGSTPTDIRVLPGALSVRRLPAECPV